MPTQKGEKNMKRDGNMHDIPKTLYSTLPKLTKRTIRPAGKGTREIIETRLGNMCLYWSGTFLVAFTHIYASERNNEKAPLVHEMFCKNNDIGRDVAAFLEEKEVTFLGDKFKMMDSGKSFMAEFMKELAILSTTFIDIQLEKVLAQQNTEN